MSKKTDKQIGDLVTITAGANKGQEGALQEKVSKGWNIKLQNGEVVLVAFFFIKLLAKADESQESPQLKDPQNIETLPEPELENSAAEEIAGDSNENPSPASEETGEVTVEASEDADLLPEDSPADQEADGEIAIPENIKKMTVAQLRDMAKEKGVSIARTKDDFLRIIKSMNHEEDLKRLKGKVLFDRVSELHVSRLRSKEDLQRLLERK